MSHREPVKTHKDQVIYRNTAKKTKAINVKPKNSRGGIRL